MKSAVGGSSFCTHFWTQLPRTGLGGHGERARTSFPTGASNDKAEPVPCQGPTLVDGWLFCRGGGASAKTARRCGGSNNRRPEFLRAGSQLRTHAFDKGLRVLIECENLVGCLLQVTVQMATYRGSREVAC